LRAGLCYSDWADISSTISESRFPTMWSSKSYRKLRVAIATESRAISDSFYFSVSTCEDEGRSSIDVELLLSECW